MFTSEDPVPQVKQDIDDPLYAYVNPPIDTTPTLNNEPHLIVEAGPMYDFIQRPTLKHARRLLKAYAIPEPLKSITKQTRSKRHTQQRAGSLIPPNNKNIINKLLYYDTLHDLLHAPNVSSTSCLAFAKPYIDIPPNIKKLYLSGDYAFTRTVFDTLRQEAQISIHTYETKNAHAIDQTLIKRLASPKHPITFVLDNVIANIRHDATMSEATIGYLAGAFILCLATNMSRINPDLAMHPITLYDGLFLQIDGTYIPRFISLFLRSIKRCTKCPSARLHNLKDTMSPLYFNEALDTNIHVTSSQGIVHRDMVFPITPFAQNISHTSPSFPHSKADFQKLFALSNKQQKGDLATLNFLRDAFKADVAMQQDAIYVTHDRLAYLYYLLIGGKQGVLLSISRHDNNTLYSISV